MPIKAENRGRYPKDWTRISAAVREEADNRCEWCCAPNGVVICRGQGPFAGSYMVPDGAVHCERTGEVKGVMRGSEYVGRFVKVVLTVAHLNHQPEDNRRENLAALCQKCHLNYDAAHHAKNARKTRRAKLADDDLFPEAG